MNAAALLLVLGLLITALVAGITAARQARRLPAARTPSAPTRGSDFPPPMQRQDPSVDELPSRERPRPKPPAETPFEDDANYRAFRAALDAHSKIADRKALYSNLLFFAAGVLASILTTLLVHPL
ncbi:hypothetical protein F1D05_12815 [Kribbella qitaiheensis]|uniref:Uncharacterized protein n=1 Tax=Kribbella qitaiheensis TaxID=1544730 RepID=A0A7G6WXB4_9ACTN|nr:hypothetical protein [Kribbella qitaiheensis]QNE18629.1 hypothetical protein F1D05_12815 [Kribbella qitaiheensis]